MDVFDQVVVALMMNILIDPGRGKTTFGFSLDLGLLEGHRGWPVRETYVGDLMALRHRILVSAQRPWYTFNVYNQVREGTNINLES